MKEKFNSVCSGVYSMWNKTFLIFLHQGFTKKRQGRPEEQTHMIDSLMCFPITTSLNLAKAFQTYLLCVYSSLLNIY